MLKDKCGIFGIFDHSDSVRLTYLGLFALQHRGQESAGIVTSSGEGMNGHRGMGLVADIFTADRLENLSGNLAMGHVRYSTTGSSLLKNAQPFQVDTSFGPLAIGHNGNLINARYLRDKLEDAGSIFQSTMDSELIVHLITKSKKNKLEDKLVDALSRIKGAYSLLLMTENQLIAARDPRGFRPLCLGKLENSFVVASETCALDLIQAKYLREVEPGEIVIIDKSGIRSIKPFPKARHSFCIFEYIYFARPDSDIFGENVYLTRKRQGARLAMEHPVKADLVAPIPDSGNYAALGFAEISKIPFELAIIRNHYIGRTFIQPSQYIRDFGVKVKLNPVRGLLGDKRIVVIEDSIVRGTTSKTRVRTLREAGAREVHMRVSCPPHKYPCFYGIDFPTREELIASANSVDEIRDYLGLDSLGYLSLKGLLVSMPLPKNKFCVACFTGDYPVKPKEEISKCNLERSNPKR